MYDGITSRNRDTYAVRSCTEQRGVWIERFFPPRAKDRFEELIDEYCESVTGHEVGKPDGEPDQYMFIPGDIIDRLAAAMAGCDLEVSEEDDYYLAVGGDDDPDLPPTP